MKTWKEITKKTIKPTTTTNWKMGRTAIRTNEKIMTTEYRTRPIRTRIYKRIQTQIEGRGEQKRGYEKGEEEERTKAKAENLDNYATQQQQTNKNTKHTTTSKKQTMQKLNGIISERQHTRQYTMPDQKEKKELDAEEAFAPLSEIYFEGKSEMLDDLNSLYQEAATRIRAQKQKKQMEQQINEQQRTPTKPYQKNPTAPHYNHITTNQTIKTTNPEIICTEEKTIRIKLDVYEPDYIELPVVGTLEETMESARVALGIEHGDVMVNVATEAVVCHVNDLQENALYLLETKEAYEDYYEQITPRTASLKKPSTKRTILWFSNKIH